MIVVWRRVKGQHDPRAGLGQPGEDGCRVRLDLSRQIGAVDDLQPAVGQHAEKSDTGDDIRVVGDRFVFQSEVLFGKGAAALSPSGQQEIAKLAALCDSGEVTCRGVRDLTLRHLDAINAKIRDLQQLGACRSATFAEKPGDLQVEGLLFVFAHAPVD